MRAESNVIAERRVQCGLTRVEHLQQIDVAMGGQVSYQGEQRLFRPESIVEQRVGVRVRVEEVTVVAAALLA